jgi:hypothetical protein
MQQIVSLKITEWKSRDKAKKVAPKTGRLTSALSPPSAECQKKFIRVTMNVPCEAEKAVSKKGRLTSALRSPAAECQKIVLVIMINVP